MNALTYFVPRERKVHCTKGHPHLNQDTQSRRKGLHSLYTRLSGAYHTEAGTFLRGWGLPRGPGSAPFPRLHLPTARGLGLGPERAPERRKRRKEVEGVSGRAWTWRPPPSTPASAAVRSEHSARARCHHEALGGSHALQPPQHPQLILSLL